MYIYKSITTGQCHNYTRFRVRKVYCYKLIPKHLNPDLKYSPNLNPNARYYTANPTKECVTIKATHRVHG